MCRTHRIVSTGSDILEFCSGSVYCGVAFASVKLTETHLCRVIFCSPWCAALFVVLPVQAAEPAPAVVEIVLPPNAKLYLGDDLIRSRPGTHRLDTPPLQQGKTYTYEFRIEIERDGKTETFKAPSMFGLAKRRKPTSPISSRRRRNPICRNRWRSNRQISRNRRTNPSRINPPRPSSSCRTWSAAFVDHTNAERKKKDLPELKPNPKLFAAARKHSEHMARLDKMAHELEGSKVTDRVKEAGYPVAYLAENCRRRSTQRRRSGQGLDEIGTPSQEPARTPSTPRSASASPRPPNGTLYFTQVFGKPLR